MKEKPPPRPGKGANRDPRVRLMRSANTTANYRYGMGGLPKTKGAARRQVTLPTVPWKDDGKPTKES